MDRQQVQHLRMGNERARRKIQAVINSVEADLDNPESEHYNLNPKNRALFLMQVKREMTEDAAKAGVLLSTADLNPFDKKIKKYLREVKEIKENAIKLEQEEMAIKAGKAKKAREKRERKAAKKQLKKKSDAVTKIATTERGRQARTLKKRMKQSNKLSDLMKDNDDIPDDEDLPYFDESGQLTERQKQLADKMAQGGKRKTRRRKKKKSRKTRRKTRKKRRRKSRKKRKTRRRKKGGVKQSAFKKTLSRSKTVTGNLAGLADQSKPHARRITRTGFKAPKPSSLRKQFRPISPQSQPQLMQQPLQGLAAAQQPLAQQPLAQLMGDMSINPPSPTSSEEELSMFTN
jgi:hypothetical protein